MPWKNITQEEKRIYDRAWYAKQSKRKKRQIAEIKQIRRHKIRQAIVDFKKTLKCSKCPENDPVCLDFHHSKNNKEISIGNALNVGWSIDKIKKEISKCIVLCSNCHRKEHND
jgi:hypothetical protein